MSLEKEAPKLAILEEFENKSQAFLNSPEFRDAIKRTLEISESIKRISDLTRWAEELTEVRTATYIAPPRPVTSLEVEAIVGRNLEKALK